jgi:hypothetical protein
MAGFTHIAGGATCAGRGGGGDARTRGALILAPGVQRYAGRSSQHLQGRGGQRVRRISTACQHMWYHHGRSRGLFPKIMRFRLHQETCQKKQPP